MKKYLIITVSFSFFLFSCRKEEVKKFEGPSLEDLYGVFDIVDSLTLDKSDVDFSAGEKVIFSASFTKNIDWKISIVGLTSGANKIIEGKGKVLESTTAFWDGSTTNFPIFKSESCKITMTFKDEPDTMITFVTVTNPKTNAGFLVADFESGFNAGWTKFAQSGASMDFQIHTDVAAPQGNSYFHMQGIVNWDYLIGYVNFNASATGNVTFPLQANPEKEYFNVMLYGEENIDNAIILFQFLEDENGDGVFNASSDDQYNYEVKIDWKGWKLVSVKYADIINMTNGVPTDPNGNKQHNPDKIKQVNMLHLADPATGISIAKMDYIIFTENAPLNP